VAAYDARRAILASNAGCKQRALLPLLPDGARAALVAAAKTLGSRAARRSFAPQTSLATGAGGTGRAKVVCTPNEPRDGRRGYGTREGRLHPKRASRRAQGVRDARRSFAPQTTFSPGAGGVPGHAVVLVRRKAEGLTAADAECPQSSAVCP